MGGGAEQTASPRLSFRCPACARPLAAGSRCGACGREHEQALAGIVDLRLAYPDPQLTRDEDARIARELALAEPDHDLARLLEQHWRLVGKRPELAARFTGQERGARARSEALVTALEEARGRAIGPADRVLEIGCGTAALTAALTRRGADAVASDVSLRWLVLARKRLAEEAVTGVELVACAGEILPFADGSFELVVATDVVEHVENPRSFVAECARVLRPGGLVFLSTPNRFSLGLEPHVRLWGVGFLPRRLAERYVRAARKTSYDHVRLLSSRALARLLAENGLRPRIVLPPVPDSSLALYRGPELRLAKAYNHVVRWRPAQPLLRAGGPFFHVFGHREH